MTVKENELLFTALRNLDEALGGGGKVSNPYQDNTRVTILGKEFVCLVRLGITKTSYGIMYSAIQRRNDEHPILLIVGDISNELFERAKTDGINVLDAAGNCEIMPPEGPFLSIRGRKNEVRRIQARNLVFRTAGLKVLYYLLLNPSNIRKTFRDIQEQTGVSLGTVKNVIDSLEPNFSFVSGKTRNLKNGKDLLNLWTEGYNQVLKPGLLLSRMAFVKGIQQQWQDLQLPEGIVWGGECGAYLIDGYLTPGLFELYTEQPSNVLLKTGKMVPAVDGNILVYQKFWKTPSYGISPVVVYADLMGSGDGRCIEEAQRILDNDLPHLQ